MITLTAQLTKQQLDLLDGVLDAKLHRLAAEVGDARMALDAARAGGLTGENLDSYATALADAEDEYDEWGRVVLAVLQ